METESPPLHDSSLIGSDTESNLSIHPFNITNITVIETQPGPPCEGSDSGVELPGVSQGPPSCSSSISGCSNYEDAFALLVRRNSTLLECYPRTGDATSDNGSESSSTTSGIRKKKVQLPEKAPTGRSRPPPTAPTRLKSVERAKPRKSTPALDIKKDRKAPTPKVVTPTDDGRWPSIHSRPAPLMSRSFRATIETTPKSAKEVKTIEKYATLPRRRKEKPEEKPAREESLHRLAVKKAPVPKSPASKTKKLKVRIYHEIAVQTALTDSDIDKALAGLCVCPASPLDKEVCDKGEQVELRDKEVEMLRQEVRNWTERYCKLDADHRLMGGKLAEVEAKLREETLEKEGLREELKNNSQRVLAILGEGTLNEETESGDSLVMLESRFQNVGQVVIRQEEEISQLNAFCRALRIDLELQKTTILQLHEQLTESAELQDFLLAEKSTLADALKDAENEISKSQETIAKKNKNLQERKEEYQRLTRLNEQRWQENLSLQARMGALESKSRELLVHQGSSVSGTAVALSALIGRLEGLVDELVSAYTISDQELDDVIFHNEAYSNSSSSPDATPEKTRKFFAEKTPSPKKGSSFVSAVINAIRSATTQKPFTERDVSKENLTDTSSPNEMLDSETEPCLMMESVLENVMVPDGHTHNMISSCHSMLSSQSDSFLSLTRSFSFETPSLCDILPSFPLVDQVIDVDNLVTRLLKVIRIIQLETDDCMNELQEQHEELSEQVSKQKDTNKLVGKQLRDWEVLGARLKTEVKELMHQLSRKNNEMDMIKTELNKQREEVEKLNQDVCELSTGLAKAELEMKVKEDEVVEAMKNWEQSNQSPTGDVLGRLVAAYSDVPILKAKLVEKECQLEELSTKFLANRNVLSESLKEAVAEAKKQYDAIDKALEVLQNNQNIVQQCAPLADLQRDLENTVFQSVSAMPLVPADCNANAALLQALANLQINTTA